MTTRRSVFRHLVIALATATSFSLGMALPARAQSMGSTKLAAELRPYALASNLSLPAVTWAKSLSGSPHVKVLISASSSDGPTEKLPLVPPGYQTQRLDPTASTEPEFVTRPNRSATGGVRRQIGINGSKSGVLPGHFRLAVGWSTNSLVIISPTVASPQQSDICAAYCWAVSGFS